MKDVILVVALLLAVVSGSNIAKLDRPRNTRNNGTRKTADQQCGIRKIYRRPLIVGGSDTVPGEWPWHAAVYHIREGGRVSEYKCGGTLVNSSFILTTASCARYGVDKPEGAIVVELGQYNLGESFAQVQRIPVTRAVVHEDYVHGENKFDLGVLQLKTPANYSDYVQPACMPKPGDRMDDYEDVLGTIVGWGFVKAGTLSDKLQSAQVPAISVIECLQSDRDFYAREIYSGMYCAGRQNGTAPCFGDAGGGMFFRAGRTWTLRGIISFTSRVYTETAGCNTENYFGLVNVAHFLPWIESTIASLRSGRPTTE